MRLTSNGKVKYSDRDRKVFELLRTLERTDGLISSTILTEEFYGGAKRVPFHGRTIVRSAVDALARKASHNGESFRIVKSGRRGPHPIGYRIERRAS